MGTELFTGTSENLHILTVLPAREIFIEFCCREGFKTYKKFIYSRRKLQILRGKVTGYRPGDEH